MKRFRALALSAAILVAGCGVFVAPSPTPAEMDDVISALVLRDVTIHNLVSGDAGCPGSNLHSNGVHMEVAIGAQSALRDVYLLRWRNTADYDVAAAAFAACVAEYESAHPGTTITEIDSTPWRVYGPTWSDQLKQIVTDTLHTAGGG